MDKEKIKTFFQEHKETITVVIILLFLFFIGGSILFSTITQVNRNYKKELEANNKEKEAYQKRIIELTDSINYWERQANSAILKDTVYLTLINKEKTKTHEELNVIAVMPHDSSMLLHSKLTEEYIQTGFTPDSSE